MDDVFNFEEDSAHEQKLKFFFDNLVFRNENFNWPTRSCDFMPFRFANGNFKEPSVREYVDLHSESVQKPVQRDLGHMKNPIRTKFDI